MRNGAGDLFVVDGDDLVDVARDEREGEVAGAADGDAVGDGGFRLDGDGVAGLAGAEHGGELVGFNTDDADTGAGLFEGAGDAADEASAADGDDDRFQIRHLLQELEGDGSLAGDDFGVVKGVDEGSALFAVDGGGLRRRLRRSWRRGG